ncbi:MAG: 30S ribosomal protein S16 [Burkholderiales bacterium]
MVSIRMNRGGAKGRPFYNIVATDSQNRRDGRFIERVGFYNPIASEKEESLRFDVARVNHWRGLGAQVSPSVERLLKQFAKKAPAAA